MKKKDFFSSFLRWAIKNNKINPRVLRNNSDSDFFIRLWRCYLDEKLFTILLVGLGFLFFLLPSWIAGIAVLSFQLGLFFSVGSIQVPLWLLYCFATVPIEVGLLIWLCMLIFRYAIIDGVDANNNRLTHEELISLEEYIKENFPES